MKKEYRAVLRGVPTDRPRQCISLIEKVVFQWGDDMLKCYPEGIVEFYVRDETLLGRICGSRRECLNCQCAASRHLMSATGGNNKYGACAGCRECPQFVSACEKSTSQAQS